ncbi:hypothetical protein ACJMK2_025567 [Sinanodonta woodiana]|uniref:Uncharacterized protein n=1 Tax=Sinanodonta woodiana TaxID=1069815 RepID=A0ABD3XGZ4_SINWO
MLQRVIQKEFKGRKIVVPHDVGMVVLKGAVVFGHDTGAISERIAKYTYGVSAYSPSIEVEDDEKYKIVNGDGYVEYENIFTKHVEIGQSIQCDERFQRQYHPSHSKKYIITVKLFATQKENPKYVTDLGCFKVGEMRVDVDTKVSYEDRNYCQLIVWRHGNTRKRA